VVWVLEKQHDQAIRKTRKKLNYRSRYLFERVGDIQIVCVEVVSKGVLTMVYNTELLGSWTSSIVWYSREQKTRRFGNWSCFHTQVRGGGHLLSCSF
jgi:hypothetical protein